jgi:hypothetical protein
MHGVGTGGVGVGRGDTGRGGVGVDEADGVHMYRDNYSPYVLSSKGLFKSVEQIIIIESEIIIL